MPTTQGIPAEASKPSAYPHVHMATERCPLCDQPIPPEKYKEIHGRIQAKERERALETDRRLKEQVAQEKAQAEAKARAEIEQLRKDNAAALEKSTQEAKAKEAAARAEARKAAEAAAAVKIAEIEQAKKAAEQQLQTAKADQENRVNQLLKEQREALEKANAEALNTEKSKAFTEKLKLEEQLQAVTRQLQQKTADQLGEGAEVDLFEALKTEFPEDKISRVGKGTPGADIIHDVMHKGNKCGCIIYDSKNRNAWRNEYVTKLRQDQISASADHAILSTSVFPSGARQVHMQDGVMIANPARVLTLVQMLRKHVIQIQTLRLSSEAREQKTARLYEFITSERAAQLLELISARTEDMLELDVKEKKAHDANWKRRGELVRSVQRAHADFTTEIDRIVSAVTQDSKI